MAKRNNYGSDERTFGSEDNPIGLTEAFKVIRDPQAVEYDEDDQSIGLAEAFGAVSGEEDEVHSWDEAGKWSDFDWDSVPDVDESGAVIDAPEKDVSEEAPLHEASEDVPPEDGLSADVSEQVGETAEGGFASEEAVAGEASLQQAPRKRGKHGRHAAPEPELTPRMKKSKRTRKVLIVIVILLILLAGALGYFIYKTFAASQEEAAHQAHEQVAAASKESMSDAAGHDTVDTTAQLTDVPTLTGLLGKTADEAVEELGRGALITQNRKVKEKGSNIKTNMTVALTEEPADAKTGTPTVYLGLNKKGKIIQVGYSAAASALGFGSLSFSDAVSSEHVVEKTLARIGVDVKEGSAVLPSDKSKYSTYQSDGKTIAKERCSFSGDTDIDGKPCEWSAVLSYDYTTQIVTGDLSDTVRIIYVYVTQN